MTGQVVEVAAVALEQVELLSLITPDYAALRLEPNQTPTALSSVMEHHLIQFIRTFEDQFGTGIITLFLI